jgi:hypothetical protein
MGCLVFGYLFVLHHVINAIFTLKRIIHTIFFSLFCTENCIQLVIIYIQRYICMEEPNAGFAGLTARRQSWLQRAQQAVETCFKTAKAIFWQPLQLIFVAIRWCAHTRVPMSMDGRSIKNLKTDHIYRVMGNPTRFEIS